MFEEINNGTLHVLWVQKNASNEGLVFVARVFFVNGFWQLDPKPPNRMSNIRQYQRLINILKGSTWDEVPKTGNNPNKSAYFQCNIINMKFPAEITVQ